ncbi:MAG: lambda exonuclease family protein [Rickettsiales bacterium]
MEIITDIEQGSEEWHALRYGWITASRFKDVMSNGRGGAESKTRKSYMLHLAAECLTDMRVEAFTNEHMEWGTQTEPQARSMYELESGNEVHQVAFIRHGRLKAGCSPDGLIGDLGMIEIKCPKTTTQIETHLSGKMPAQHKAQVQGQLWVSGREWCDFVSFDPRINGSATYFCTRIERDEDYIAELSQKVESFEIELKELIGKLT